MSGLQLGGDGSPTGSCAGPPGTRFSEIRWFAETDSTNRDVVDAARAGAAEGLVVAADHQRAGRGRLGRRWEAPPGRNLLVSILLRPRVPAEQLHLCTAVVALAAADGLRGGSRASTRREVAQRPRRGRAQARRRPGRGGRASDPTRPVVVGIGVNCRLAGARRRPRASPPLPARARGLATSLWRESGRRVDPARPARAPPRAISSHGSPTSGQPRGACDRPATTGAPVRHGRAGGAGGPRRGDGHGRTPRTSRPRGI